ncbi:FAD-dependent oxidoreductase [Zooshikella marina]|uniref:FAD-dependent oxidoreductase n=1 Tax=Zooshikella ganghwensis TaxID=202772 RepID=UPI001BAF4327|nr:FAD-dependent oxidoreductase [Zooshikella ganghwensis]MBU2706227.1 FAD-dependent oxidoreductase [Zooshikella ganghwensis]
MQQVRIETDVIVIGGGIAGLWLTNALHKNGFQTLLLEEHQLGGIQTSRSQGIIHGGTKYALSGNLTKASECIAGMPDRWRKCLNGTGEFDLSQVKVLSPHHYLWSTAGIGSKLTTFFASKALRGRVTPLQPDNIPHVFRNPKFKGSVYQLNELVLDIPSLVDELVKPIRQQAIKVDWQNTTQLLTNEQHEITGIKLQYQDVEYLFTAKRYVFTSGEGTASLMTTWGINEPKQQTRPLHMVMVKHSHPNPLYAHCIGTSTVPRLTVSSHPTADGDWVWYLGGEIAETGVKRSASEQIEIAQKELKKLLPWIDFSEAQWATLHVNRAEPKQLSYIRPDAAYCKPMHNGIICWPTKLALAPNLADEVIKLLNLDGITDSLTSTTDQSHTQHLPNSLPLAPIAPPFWEDFF